MSEIRGLLLPPALASLRAAAEPWWSGALSHPFVVALAAGTLAPERFRAYLLQDAQFLLGYIDACLRHASAWSDPADKLFFLEAARLSAVAERGLHESCGRRLGFGEAEIVATEPAPDNLAYQNHLRATVAFGSRLEGLAALTPCNWLYGCVGRKIMEQVGVLERDHPFRDWIALYQDEALMTQIQGFITRLGQAWEAAEERARKRARLVFVRSVRYEWLFWQLASDPQPWPAPT